MFLDMYGPDFVRLQNSGTSRISDPLDPGVNFSGIYEDGQVYVYQVAIANSATAITTPTINFGQTFNNVPLVFGSLKLSQNVFQDGTTWFGAGEVVTFCSYYYNRFQGGRVVAWDFSWIVNKSQILLNTAGFNGTATFFVVDV